MIVDVLTMIVSEVEIDFTGFHKVQLLRGESSHAHGSHEEKIDWLQGNICEHIFNVFIECHVSK